MSNDSTLELLHAARPCTPNNRSEDFEADKHCVLAELRNAGARGCTSMELFEHGGGFRFRFILLRENPNPTRRPSRRKPAEQRQLSNSTDWYEREHGPRPSEHPKKNEVVLPLFDVVR